MKKYLYLFLSLFLIIPVGAKAAIIHCSAPGTVTSGQNFNVTFSGSLSSPASLWIATIGNSGNASYVSGNRSIVAESASMSQTVTFKAGNPGTASFYVYDVDVSDGETTYSSGDTCTVTIVAANSSNSTPKKNNSNNNTQSNKSKNNNLKSLSIDGVEMTPEFDKDTLEYSAIVEGDKDKVTISAEAEDGKASIDGSGERDLEEGLNEITIAVSAENGDVKEYKLKITRKEKNPIVVKIGKKQYTVLKKETDLEVPEGFTKTQIVINKEDVVSYSNEYTAYMLVVLVGEDGDAGFYIYDSKKETYTKYEEFKSEDLKLMLLEPNSKDVPYRYKKITFSVDGKTINGYYLEYKSPFRLVYGMNMKNGDVDFYLYDMDQKTFQRFYNVQVETYIDLIKKFKYASIGLGGLILLLFIVIISLFSKNRTLKKKLKGQYVEPKKEEKKESLEETKKIDKVDSSKANKKVLKEERKKAKLEAKAKRLEEKKQAKEAKKKEKEEQPKVDKKAVKNAQKELKRLQKEEDKKRKAEADDFLK